MTVRFRGIALILLSALGGTVLAQEATFEEAVGDALAYLVVPDWQEASEAFRSSDLGTMLEDEEVKAFLEVLEQGGEGLFDELAVEFEKQMGLPMEDAMNMVVEEAGVALLSVDSAAIEMQQKQSQAFSMAHQMTNAAYYFSLDMGRQPKSIDELVENPGDDSWYGPYVWMESPEDLLDPWGRAYKMVVADDGEVSFRSLGADGAPGGEGLDTDIGIDWGGAGPMGNPIRFLISLRVNEGSEAFVDKMLGKFFENFPPERIRTFGEDAERPYKGWEIDGDPKLMIALRGSHCVAAGDPESFERALALLDGTAAPVANPVRDELMGQCAMEAPVLTGFAHLAALLDVMPEPPAEIAAALESAGLMGLRSAGFSVGATDGQASCRFALDAEEELTGLFSLFNGQPVSGPAAFAANIPGDASGYSAASFDFGAMYDKILGIVKAGVGDEQFVEVEKMIAETEKSLGFTLEGDLFAAFGSSMYSYMRMPRGGSMIPSSVSALQLEDAEAFERVLSGLAAAGLLEVSERNYRGQRMRVLLATLGELGQNPFESEPRSPDEALGLVTTMFSGFAFTVDESGWMWLSNRAQDLKDHIDWKLDGGSQLSAHTTFQGIAGTPSANASFFSYSDGRPAFLIWYNSFMPLMQYAEGFARRAGVPMDMSLAPRGHVLAQYMQPAVSTMHSDGKTIVAELRMSSAGVGAMPAAAAVGIVAAIAIPNLLAARGAANEASAISSMRTIVSSNAMFFQGDIEGDGMNDYALSLEEMMEVGLIDNVLGSGMKSGYIFEYGTDDPSTGWWLRAMPADGNGRYFYVDESGVMRQEYDFPADENSMPLQ